MKILKDSFGRTFPYIRLSITDVCNFKCGYCLPNGYQKDKSDNRTFLTVELYPLAATALSCVPIYFLHALVRRNLILFFYEIFRSFL